MTDAKVAKVYAVNQCQCLSLGLSASGVISFVASTLMVQFQNMEKPLSNTGYYAGTLALTEIGVGSIVHGFKVPLGGNFLAINQAFILTRALKNPASLSDPLLPGQISAIAALLKSLSPAGQKLTPMLAIATQGYLYTAGILLGGVNLLGVLLGSALLSIWGVVQPLVMTAVIYGLAFGPDQIERILGYYTKILGNIAPIASEDIIKLIIGFILAKIILCWLVVALAWNQQFGLKMEKQHQSFTAKRPLATEDNTKPFSPLGGAFRDMLRPIFLIPLVLTGTFFWFAEHAWAPVIWAMLRPAALGLIAFWLIRRVPLENTAAKYGHKFSGFTEALRMIRHKDLKNEK